MIRTLMYFSQEMSKGDLVLCINSNTSVEAVGVVSGDYQYIEGGIAGKGYAHHLPVNWLQKGFSVDFQSINDNKRFNLPTCYPLSRLSVSDTISHLLSHDVDISEKDNASKHSENYVLVIDEINRGNISKIFGELITLIEPSKRQGQPEALELLLPHAENASKPFSVPSNLHIIGTMNTADRSLAMMDTALRRRFDFVEMMPDYAELDGVMVNDKERELDLGKLLKCMNHRIEFLYDREHVLGHAFFMPIVEALPEQRFALLQSVFRNKIIPLLEEYFYEDWSKIRLILGDNQKKNPAVEFISEMTDEANVETLFGNEYAGEFDNDEIVTYQINAAAFKYIESYLGIFGSNN